MFANGLATILHELVIEAPGGLELTLVLEDQRQVVC